MLKLAIPNLLQGPADITKSALENSDPLAVEAVDMFLAIIGAEAGQMALRTLATGGVYICGGIPPKVNSQTGAGQPVHAASATATLYVATLCRLHRAIAASRCISRGA